MQDLEASKNCNWNIEEQQKIEKHGSPEYDLEPHEIQILLIMPIN